MTTLPRGLYETLITEALAEQLTQLKDGLHAQAQPDSDHRFSTNGAAKYAGVSTATFASGQAPAVFVHNARVGCFSHALSLAAKA